MPSWGDEVQGVKRARPRPDVRRIRPLSGVSASAKTAGTRLDLHGLTLDEAYSAFVSFVRENAGAGRRALAVVTGRGDPAKGTGAIRREFPAWCGRLGGMISSYSPAGAGAFEIRLRKP